MSDPLLQELDAVTSVAATDLLLISDDPSGTGEAKRVTVETLRGGPTVTPSQITADQHNYSPGTTTVLRLSADADGRRITGISGGVDGRTLRLINVGTTHIQLMHEDGNSSASNRLLSCFRVGSYEPPITIARKEWADLFYDGTSSRWRILDHREPPGAVKWIPHGFVPAGWLDLLDRTARPQATYWALANILGVGGGNVLIPDLRGRTVMGDSPGFSGTSRDSARSVGATPGAENHALTANENGPHQHDVNYATSGGAGVQPFTLINASTFTGTAALVAVSGLGTPHNNVQPSYVGKFILRI